MKNQQFQFFHGFILSKIVHYNSSGHSFKSLELKSNSGYILDNMKGLYIKYSQNRITPWIFTFKKDHQDEILKIRNTFDKTFILLVCNNDGVVCLTFEELKTILDSEHKDEWVRIDRFKREKYRVSGSDGKLKYKKGNNEFPCAILYEN